MDDGNSETPHAEIPEKNLMSAEETEGWHRVISSLSIVLPENPAAKHYPFGYLLCMPAPMADIITPPPQC